MGTMQTHEKFQRRLATLHATSSKKISELAAMFRATVLAPFCSRHRLSFYSVGARGYVFETSDLQTFGSLDDAAKAGIMNRKLVAHVFKTLELEDGFGGWLASHVKPISLRG